MRVKATCDGIAAVGGESTRRLRDPVGVGGDEVGVVVEDAKLVDGRGVRSDCGSSPCDIFAVLAATGVGAVCRQHDRQRVLDPRGGHLGKRVGQQRVPVSVAPVDR